MFAPLSPHTALFGRWLFLVVAACGLIALYYCDGSLQQACRGTAPCKKAVEVWGALLFAGLCIGLGTYNAWVLIDYLYL